ncbi:cation transporter dimerization domain-containing protein [Belnapia arida]|uniref:cation transporter dimerization domain-containing protein n=1 Tax=Belnapia arida TaxID=2804533 RepID=UPI002E2D162A|nr:cation transporter dimerization domain-containing protein [Belnapia arida]
MHAPRTRHAGCITFVEFHLMVPSDMRAVETHETCDRIEGALRTELGAAVITTPVEPEGNAEHQGVLVL